MYLQLIWWVLCVCVCLVVVSLCLCLLGGFDFGFFYDFVLWVTECG